MMVMDSRGGNNGPPEDMEMDMEELEIDWGMNPSALPMNEYELVNDNGYGLMML